MNRRFSVSLAVLCSALIFVFMIPAHAHADSFSTYFVSDDQNKFFAGLNSSGQVLIDIRGIPQPPTPCTSASNDCYYTFDAGKIVGISQTKLGFVQDDGSSSCNITLPTAAKVISEVCNDGHAAWDGYLTSSQVFPHVYDGLSNMGAPTSLGYGDGPLFMNSSGDLVWDYKPSEAFFEAIPAPVSEPSSLIMLSTGIVGAVGAALRRRLQAGAQPTKGQTL